MVSTSFSESSICLLYAEEFSKAVDVLAAQKILLTLILMADDYGRGKLLPAAIRSKAFCGIGILLDSLRDDFVERCVRLAEQDGMLMVYEVANHRYYALNNWKHWQRGNWRPRQSNIPEPPEPQVPPAPPEKPQVLTDPYPVPPSFQVVCVNYERMLAQRRKTGKVKQSVINKVWEEVFAHLDEVGTEALDYAIRAATKARAESVSYIKKCAKNYLADKKPRQTLVGEVAGSMAPALPSAKEIERKRQEELDMELAKGGKDG